MIFNDWYNNEAIKIWNKFSKHELVPQLIPHTEDNYHTIFVGINPAHQIVKIKKILDTNKIEFGNHNIESIFNWNDGEKIKERVGYIAKMEAYARKHDNNYFGAIKKFANQLNLTNWTHLDIFLVRETVQNNLLNLIELNDNNFKMNDFGEQQLNLFFESIKKLNPKNVIVLNALASRLIISKLNNNKIDTTFQSNSTRYFLSSMISGQRSLDIFSKSRLINEIKMYNS